MRCHLPSLLLICLLLSRAAFTQTSTLGLNAPQLFEKGMNSLMGVGVSRNDFNAVDYLRRSAELGYPPAQVALGYFYEPAPWCRKIPAKLLNGTGRQPNRMIAWLIGFWGVSITTETEFRETSMRPSHGCRRLQIKVILLDNNCWD